MAATNLPLTALPTTYECQAWPVGNRVLLTDTFGAAQNRLYIAGDSATDYSTLMVSTDGGNTYSAVGAAFDFMSPEILGTCMDSTGKVHVFALAQGSLYYGRLALTRDGAGNITGRTVEVGGYGAWGALPAGLTITAGMDTHGSITIVHSATSNIERLFICVSGNDGASGYRSFGLVSTNITPTTAASSWCSVTGTANAVTSLGSSTTIYSYFYQYQGAQLRGSRTLVAVRGRASTGDSDDGTPSEPCGYTLCTANGDWWNAPGSLVTIGDHYGGFPYSLVAIAETNNSVWVCTGNPADNLVHFGYVDDSGTWHADAVPTISGLYNSTWGMLRGAFAVAADNTSIWSCLHAYVAGSGANSLIRFAHWDGSAWDTADDPISSTLVAGTHYPAFMGSSNTTDRLIGVATLRQGIQYSPPRRFTSYGPLGPPPDYTITVDPFAVAIVVNPIALKWSDGPPTVAAEGTSESGTANVTLYTAAIGSPANGTRVVLVVVKDGSADFSSLPSGWTVASNTLQGTAIRSAVLWRNCDGTEGATVTFGTSSAEALASHYFTLDAGTFDPTFAPAVAVNAVATANNNPAAVTTSWGSANNLCIVTIASDTNTSAAPTAPSGYGNAGSQRTTNSTTSDRVRLTWARRTAIGSTEDPAAWTSTAVASVAYTIVVKPWTSTVATLAQVATGAATAHAAAAQAPSATLAQVAHGTAAQSLGGSIVVAQTFTADVVEAAHGAATSRAAGTQVQAGSLPEAATGAALGRAGATQAAGATLVQAAHGAATSRASGTQVQAGSLPEAATGAALGRAGATQAAGATLAQVAHGAATSRAAGTQVQAGSLAEVAHGAATARASALQAGSMGADLNEQARGSALQTASVRQSATARLTQVASGPATAALTARAQQIATLTEIASGRGTTALAGSARQLAVLTAIASGSALESLSAGFNSFDVAIVQHATGRAISALAGLQERQTAALIEVATGAAIERIALPQYSTARVLVTVLPITRTQTQVLNLSIITVGQR